MIIIFYHKQSLMRYFLGLSKRTDNLEFKKISVVNEIDVAAAVLFEAALAADCGNLFAPVHFKVPRLCPPLIQSFGLFL